MKKIPIGRCEVTKVDLTLPFGLSEKVYRRKCCEVMERMAAAGERYVCLPRGLAVLAREYGLQLCDTYPALRRLAAEAVLDYMGAHAALGHVRVFSRMPTREVLECIHRLAENCRYVSVTGGRWAEAVSGMLLREYGTAAPGRDAQCRQVTVAFDTGVPYRGEEAVIDLTREGIREGNVLRPMIGTTEAHARLLSGGFCDPGPLLGHLYIHGAIGRDDLRIWCKQGPKP